MGTTNALISAAAAAVVLLALVTLATMRAKARADQRLHTALGQIGHSVSRLAETLGTVAVRATEAESAIAVSLGVAASLEIEEVAASIALAASRLPCVDAAAAQTLLESGEPVIGTSGILDDAVRRLALDPPDAARWDSAHLQWHRSASAQGLHSSGLAVPIHADGVRIGTLLAFTRSPEGFPPETEIGLVRLAASSSPALVNARRYHATLDLVRTDALTGLRNRRAYDEELALEIERARRGGTPLSLLLIDLDDFGQVNKAHSLQVGDMVLATFSGVLRATARTVDVVCRRGGEEFAVVLPDTGCVEAQRFFARLRHEVSFTQFPTINGLTFSAGLTQLLPEDDAGSMDDRASRLINDSKRAGKDRVTHDC
jgi:diguanylate cyclase (GGDEF)-like protein